MEWHDVCSDAGCTASRSSSMMRSISMSDQPFALTPGRANRRTSANQSSGSIVIVTC
jgi:hypothetical protein